ncbi:hypothetical protein SAMN05445504_2359 [Burkholderia sp. CF099]|nr:hypothetical protein SAMN05445504_2359 [Burkholderia sp. CF099]
MPNADRSLSAVSTSVSSVLVAALLLLPMSGFSFGADVILNDPVWSVTALLYVSIAVAVSTGFCVCMTCFHRSGARGSLLNVNALVWGVISFSVLLQILPWRILPDSAVTRGQTWWTSFDAVFYSLSQQVAGRSVLYDFPSQYGLFCAILAPLFRVVGLSVLSFTVVCAALQVLSLGGLFYVLSRRIKSAVVMLISGLALVSVTYETVLWLQGYEEPYFQYWPVRFFWPAVSVVAVHAFAQSSTLRRSVVVSVISSIGAIWNLDSGIMIVIAFGVYLAAKWLVSREARPRLLKAMMLHVAVVLLGWVIFATCLQVRAGHALNWEMLVDYQRTFYLLGFMMLPMPVRPDAWMSVMGMYLFGILVSARAWSVNARSRWPDLVFYLSLLGIGLFVYYQGRSHSLNLVTVCWPALLICSLLVDRSLRAVKLITADRGLIFLPIAGLAALLYCASPFLLHMDRFWAGSLRTVQTWSLPQDEYVQDEVRFIKRHSKTGEKCVILSKRQGIYYALTGLSNPIDGPGNAELLLTRDRDNLFRQLRDNRFDCVFLGKGPDSAIDFGAPLGEALSGYRVVASSNGGGLEYLVP